MTAQETFDAIVAHLRRQGEKSEGDETVGCAYRGERGLKCAVGCMIPDELYTLVMEGENVTGGHVLPVLKSLGVDLCAAQALQTIHDDHPVEEWESRFRDLAVALNLTYTEPTR
jgi:hypothetical protein